MHAAAELLRRFPELAVFVTLTGGYLIGLIKFRNFGLGSVVGTLICGLIVGQAGVDIPPFVRTVFFIFFMFATGYKVGPQLVANFGKGGLSLVAMAIVFFVTAMLTVVVLAKVLRLDAGYSAGLVSGSLTQSAIVGTATQAIDRLDLTEQAKAVLRSHIPTADAITYLFGSLGLALLLGRIAPRLMRIDVKAETKAFAHELGGRDDDERAPSFSDAAMSIDLKAVRVVKPEAVGQSIGDLLAKVGGRLFVRRARRGEWLFVPELSETLRPGDIIAVTGMRDALLRLEELAGPEVLDRDLTDLRIEVQTLVITRRQVVGLSLRELVERFAAEVHGVQARSITRQGHPLPRLPETTLQHGDVLEVIGRPEEIERAAKLCGYIEVPTERSDFVAMGVATAAGIAIGTITIRCLGVPIGVGTSGGALIGGLVLGWLHSRAPRLGRIPPPAIWLMETLGLNTFIALIGLSSAVIAVQAIRSDGLKLFLAGIVMTCVPHLVSLYFGRRVLKLNAPLLFGAAAGAGTSTPGLTAITESMGSSIPVLGYTVPFAINNVLLTASGALIVEFMS